MTDEQFCKIETAISGEKIDKVEQLDKVVFTGRELKNYIEQAFYLLRNAGRKGCLVCSKCLGRGSFVISDGYLECNKCNGSGTN